MGVTATAGTPDQAHSGRGNLINDLFRTFKGAFQPPANGPTMTHTAKNLLSTSIPAHRFMAAAIIVFYSHAWRADDVLGISSSSARQLHSGVLHVIMASLPGETNSAPVEMAATAPQALLSIRGVADATGHWGFASRRHHMWKGIS